MTAAPRPPVFIHAWWRSSSTYVWAKLRGVESLCCYYEPLHEAIGTLTLDAVRAGPNPAFPRALHHPVTDRNYYAEYQGVLEAGGTGFAKALSYDRYFLRPGEPDAALERYLGRLIGISAERGNRAVLCFCRSPLRSAWMRQRFGGLHLALLRSPRDQWGSFLEQRGLGRPYFVSGLVAIAAKLGARFPHAFAHLSCRLPDRRSRAYSPDELRHFHGVAKTLGDYNLYALFVLVWLASALQSLGVAEIVLDSDRLSGDAAARARAAARLAAEGLPADFSDCAAPRHPDLPLNPEALDSIEAAAARALACNARELVVADEAKIEPLLEELSPASREILRRALDELRRG
ncbi:MAG: hypothetical protein HYU77_00060 [Betaproteobacteria bacterium]|nr:hypothetical protein [Betaproteobacteria bacterium]